MWGCAMSKATSSQRRASRLWWASAFLAVGAAGAFASMSSAQAAGPGSVTPCTASQISVSYEVGIDARVGGYAVTGVRVADFPAQCAAQRVAVTVHDAAGGVLGTATGELETGAVLAMPASAHVAASQAASLTISAD
jgi:hypothetical protein